jgi:hypothetical protein
MASLPSRVFFPLYLEENPEVFWGGKNENQT